MKQQRQLERRAARPAELSSEQKRAGAITVGAIVALAALVIGIIVGVVLMLQKDEPVDYLNDDLSRYIYISPEKYRNFEVDIHIKAPSDVDVDIVLMKYQTKLRSPIGNATYEYEGELGVGDEVLIYYRGYTVNENGEQVPFDGGCNFSDTSPSPLVLGSGSFISGFEYGMLGTCIEDYPQLIESGEITAGQTVYVTFERVGADGVSEYCENMLLDLSGNVDGIMGAGFTDAIIGKQIGAAIDPISVTLDGKQTSYRTLKVRFATAPGAEPMTVSAYFPHDYGKESLNGRTVSFDVYAVKYIDYNVPEIDGDFIKNEIGVSDEELALHAGNTALERLKNMIRAELDAEYITAREALIEDAAWNHLMENASVYRLPRYEVDRKYAVYYSELESLYQYYGASYASIGEFIRRYYGLSASADWQAFLTEQARVAVAQKLLFYYVMREEGWMPDAQEYARLYEALVDEHVEQKLVEDGYNRDDYATEEAYEAAVSVLRKRVVAQYGQTYFMDIIYTEYGTPLLLEGVTVNQK